MDVSNLVDLANAGATAMLAWHVGWTMRKTIPFLLTEFRKMLMYQHERCAEEMDLQRKMFQTMLEKAPIVRIVDERTKESTPLDS